MDAGPEMIPEPKVYMSQTKRAFILILTQYVICSQTAVNSKTLKSLNPISLAKRRLDWSYINKVGGIAVDQPAYLKHGSVWLPVRCDISGLKATTTQPTTINSGWVICEIKTKVQGHRILLWLFACPAHGVQTTVAGDVRLGKLAAGEYDVLYKSGASESPIGKIIVPRQ